MLSLRVVFLICFYYGAELKHLALGYRHRSKTSLRLTLWPASVHRLPATLDRHCLLGSNCSGRLMCCLMMRNVIHILEHFLFSGKSSPEYGHH